MAKDPAFLFYPSDFLTGVTFLTDEEVGKYIRLLCLMHQHGRLDEESISKAIGLVSVKLRSKFSIDENGLWFNARLESETEKRAKFTESRRNNGLLGGRGKKKDKAIGLANGKATENLSINENENINKDVIVINNKGANEKFSIMLLESESLISNIQFQNKLGLHDAKKLIDMFIQQVNDTNEYHANYTDYSKHCINWCKHNVKLVKEKAGKLESIYNNTQLAKLKAAQRNGE
jgi:uncharacterized protein YdaU (DUF1376 family)/uncharacterized protein YggL (DUF469 family)